MMKLNENYNREQFIEFLDSFLPDFGKDTRQVEVGSLKTLDKAQYLGKSKKLDLQIFEFTHKITPESRIALATDGFRVMRDSASFQALVSFYNPEIDEWRLSLMTATPEITEKGKVSTVLSNPRRYSFALGSKAKINTPYNFLIKKGGVENFEELKERFSVEVVNKEFYMEIAELYTELVGGIRGKGRNKNEYPGLIKLPSVAKDSEINHEFAIRLIGRIVFCWFLREKKSKADIPLIPPTVLSLDTLKQESNYYHEVLEPLFFETLNKPLKSRKEKYAKEPYDLIPYLNGGLFTPHLDDFYSSSEGKQAVNNNTVTIPDEWLVSLFEILELYNFTIDENTAVDIDLSIDPEMLGRIFENLLAEINPETGETARKNTGSYYTPREVVNYMIDESLFYYLKSKTKVADNKLRSLITYDLNDDLEYPVENEDKPELINALNNLKLLDPACGSGAFPIGALQKILYILQVIDPEGMLWFEQQISNVPPEIKRLIEREFKDKNLDYVRKLGIIRNSIFGVDIQPIATEISRLRCFLTLIVDELVRDKEDNRGIEPLPNLDFKFVTANTLIDLNGLQKGGQQVGLFEDREGIDELKELRDMFFSASGYDREQLKLQFVQTQNKMFKKLIDEGRRGHAELTTQLTTWEPFTNKISDWFDAEWMFGNKNGFDIVIANPPYVFSRENLTEEQKNLFKKQYILTQFKINLYVLFIEKAYKLLNGSGTFSFIVPNNWLTLSTASKLRHFILTKGFDVNITLNYEQVFKSASVDTCILTFSATGEKEISFHSWTKNGIELLSSKKPDYFLKKKGYIISNINKSSEAFGEILSKIDDLSVELGTVCEVKNGVQAYTVGEGTPTQTKEMKEKRVYHSEEKEDENWIKYLDGVDVERYALGWSGQYIKYGNNLSRSRQPHLFEGGRILIRQIPSTPPYCIVGSYIKERAVVDNNCIIVKKKDEALNIKFVLALLNSRLITFWFIYTFGKLQRKTFPQFKVKEMRIFPIKMVSNEKQRPFIKIVDEIYLLKQSEDYDLNPQKASRVKVLENQIDQMVYQIYGLTQKEIKIIEITDKP